MLKPQLQGPLFQLFDAGELLRQRSHRRDDLPQLQLELAEALAAVELAFPCSEQDLKLHNWVHQGQQIERLGPSYVSAQWSFEREWHILCQGLLNTARPEPSIASNICYMAAALQDQLTTASADSNSSALAGLQGQSLDDDGGSFTMEASWEQPHSALPAQAQLLGRSDPCTMTEAERLAVHKAMLAMVAEPYSSAWSRWIADQLDQPGCPAEHRPTVDAEGNLVWTALQLLHWLPRWPGRPQLTAYTSSSVLIDSLALRHGSGDGAQATRAAHFCSTPFSNEPATLYFGQLQRALEVTVGADAATARTILLEVKWYKPCVIGPRQRGKRRNQRSGLDEVLGMPCFEAGWGSRCTGDALELHGSHMVAPVPITIVERPRKKTVVLSKNAYFWEELLM